MSSPSLVYAALSVHSFITKVGDYAGFLAIIGVALLVIMYFVHARETAILRDRAEDAEDRLAQLEYQVDQANRAAAAAQQLAGAAQATAAQSQAAVARPPIRPAVATGVGGVGTVAAPVIAGTTAAAPATGLAASSRPATATIPQAPFGTAAPALSAATRMIPAPVVPDVQPAAPDPVAIPQPPPSTVAANGVEPPVVPPPVAARAAGERPTPPPPSRGTAARRDYRAGGAEGRRIGRGSWVVAGLLVAVIVVAAVLIVLHKSNSSSGTSSTHRAAASTSATHGSKKHGKATGATKTVNIIPSQVTVAVLNGTSTTDLAADVSQKLAESGFQQGPTGNAPDQTETTTIVGYLPGQRNQALSVAKSLDLSNNVVKPVAASDRQVACSATPSNCAAQVVVVVGADLASIA
jgi:hypothetical protein